LNQDLLRNFTRAAIGPVRKIIIKDEQFPRESWNLKPMRARLQKRSQASKIVSPGNASQVLFLEKTQVAQNQRSIQIDDANLRCLPR
jgi:hypothetical protein